MLTEDHVVVAVDRYCRVYPVAPATADQLRVAELDVIFVLTRLVGDTQDVVPVVENEAVPE